MDINTTEYSMAVNESVLEQITEQTIDTEFTMPEYCPSIARILKCRVTAGVLSRNLQGKNMQIEGLAHITVFYVDAENNICTYQHISPFSKNLELPEEVKDANCTVQCKVGYVSCKAVGEKKCSIHAALGISAEIMQNKKIKVLSGLQGVGFEQDCQVLPGSNLVTKAEKYVLVEDGIDLDTEQPTINKIVYTQTSAVMQGCKVVGNKLVAKGEVYTDVLYATDLPNTFQKIRHTIPFSQIIDTENVTEQCMCDASVEICNSEFKARTNLTGEVRSISAQIKLLVVANVYSLEPVTIIKDAYATKNKYSIQSQTVQCEALVCAVNEHFLCKKTLEFTQNSVAKIVDIWCESGYNTVRIEEGYLKIEGAVTACMLVNESDGSPHYIERSIDFTYKYAVDCSVEDFRCIPTVTVMAADCLLLEQDKVELKVDLLIQASAFALYKCEALTGVTIFDELQPQEDVSAILYFARKGEKVWDIAKQYRTCKRYIMQHNTIGEILEEDKMLVIPT